MLQAVALALLVGAALFVGSGRISAGMIRRYLLSDQAVFRRNSMYMDNFQKYVEEYRVASTDRAMLAAWCRLHSGLSLTVSQNDEVIFKGEDHRKPGDSSFPFVISIGPGDQDAKDSVRRPHAVRFSNGRYLVTIVDTNENRYYWVGTCVSLGIAAVGFLLVMVLYSRHITQTVIRLSKEVQAACDGEPSREITVRGNDELAGLAQNINQMRAAILEQTRQEAIAWQANRDLITSLSHDLRTPLTTLIGYLNLIADGDFADPAELHRYASTALEKAMRLKTLSDELFRYFLVYGRSAEPLQMEEYDAQVLLEQLLGERVLRMMECGYRFRQVNRAGVCRIRTNVDSLMRVFDNIFSNLEKYADPSESIMIYIAQEKGQLTVSITNKRHDNPTQSTQIGLETCRKLMADLGGAFRAAPGLNKSFTAEWTLPLCTP